MKKTMTTIAIIGIAMMTTMAYAASPAADLAVKINGLSADPLSLFTPLGDGTAITEFNGGATAAPVYRVANGAVVDSEPGNNWSGALMRVGAGNGYAYQDFAGPGVSGNPLYRYRSGIGWDIIDDAGFNGGLDRYWGLGNGGVVSEYESNSWYIDPAGKVHAHGTEGSATVAGGLVTAGNGYLYKHYANLGQYGNSLYRFNANGNGGTGEWSNLGTEGGADRMTGLGNGMILNSIAGSEYLIRLDGTVSDTGAPAGVSNLRGGGGFAFGNVGSVMHVFDSSTETWTAIDDSDGGNWGIFASAPVDAVVMDTGFFLSSLGLGTTYLINPQGGPGFQIFDTGGGAMGGFDIWDGGNGIAYFDQADPGLGGPGQLYMLDTTPTTTTWLAPGSGFWNVDGNWSIGGQPKNQNYTVVLGDSLVSPATIVVETPVTVNRIEFNNSNHTHEVAGLGSVNLAATDGAANPSIDVQAGTHEFQTPVTLQDDTAVTVASSSTLTFNHVLTLGGNTLNKDGDGTLQINNILASGGGTVNCLGGTCGGSGTIGGSLNNSGGTVSPGNSPGAMTGVVGVVPEPSTALLLALGLMSAPGLRRRSRSDLRSGK